MRRRKPNDRERGPSLIQDPERAPLIRLVFEQVAAGRFSKREVLSEVTALALRTKRGKPLSDQSFGSLLRNPIYAGRIRVPKFSFEGPSDFRPIVDEPLFAEVQGLLDGRKPSNVSRNRHRPDFPLRRFVRCGRCGRPLTGSWSQGRNRRFPYYRCPTSGCSTRNMAKSDLEQEFRSKLGELATEATVTELFGEILRDVWRDRNAAERNRLKRAEELLTNPARFWETLPADQKPVLQEAIYPNEIAFNDGKLGTEPRKRL